MTAEREELLSLVRAFRGSLEALVHLGCQAVPVGDVTALPLDMVGSAGESAEKSDALAQIRSQLGDCSQCNLSVTRKQIVFGCGDANAKLMFVGEAPGAAEDRQGIPFVGPAGQLLDKMVGAMGLRRESVYIANVLKCRPPGNRDPRRDEVEACQGILSSQIATIAPEVIVTLGKPAAHLLLQTTASMGSLRGVWQSYNGIPVLPTYHPAYLLRDATKKREAWSDLQQVMRFLKERGLPA